MSRDRNVVKQFFKSMSNELSGVEFFGYLGNREGVVKADNLNNVWVLLFNGSVVKARNKVAPLVSRTPVAVGYTKEDPKLLQVLRVMNVYDRNTQPYLPPHAKSHSWPGADTVSIRAEQIVPGLALPSGGMVVQYYGWPYEIDGAWYYIRSREFDLTSYIPETGAVWVSVEVDDAGDITYTESDPAASKDLLTFAMLPVVPETRVMLFAVKCYTGQTEVVKTELDNDIFDPRLTLHARQAAAVWGEITGTITDQTDLISYLNSLIGSFVIDLPVKTTPVNDDRFVLGDSEDSYATAQVTWTNIKATLKAYFDTLYQAALGYTAENTSNKTDAMAGNTASSTKYLSAKGVYDWAVATFQAALGYTAENSANKTDTMSGNTASSTKYLSAKGVYDWAVATFQAISTALSQIAGLTPSDDDILQRKSGAWTNRTIAQYKSDLALNWELIEDKQLGSDTASFDFTSIPSGYKHLKLMVSARSTRSTGLTTTDKVMLKFNNDTGSNYVARVQWSGGNEEQNTAGGVYHLSYIDGSGSPSNWYSNFELTVFDYANTTTYKTWQSRGMQAATTGASQFYVFDGMGIYLSTSAISRITLTPNAGPNFKAYSRATLFGAR